MIETEPLTRSMILDLAEAREGPCVSLLMKTAASGERSRQGSLRFKNLVHQAELELRTRGVRRLETDTLLGPAEKLLMDTPFWSNQMEGLAVFLEGGRQWLFPLPFPVSDRVFVGDKFYVKSLLKAGTGDIYYVLSLDLNGFQLFHCGPEGVRECQLKGVSNSPLSYANSTDSATEPRHTTGMSGSGRAHRDSSYQGRVGGYEHSGGSALSEWLCSLAKAVEEYLRETSHPLVLFGVEYVVGEYRSHDGYPQTVGETVLGSPARKSPKDLQKAGWEKVKGLFEEKLKRELARLHPGSGATKSVRGLRDCLQAAEEGKVQHLFVADDSVYWGSVSGQTHELSQLEKQDPMAEELFERVCLETLRAGGEVSVVPTSLLLNGEQVAASLRF